MASSFSMVVVMLCFLSSSKFSKENSAAAAITCSQVADISNGRVQYSTQADDGQYSFGTVATLSCSPGFILIGSQKRECVSAQDGGTMGVFNGSNPTCTAITCEPLQNPPQGTITYSTEPGMGTRYQFGTTATYNIVCGEGMERNDGDVVRTCVGDGSSPNGLWNGTTLECLAQSVYLTLRGKTYYTNNSVITITEIGPDDSNALVCLTNSSTCCRGMDNPHGTNGFGLWLYPDGNVIQKESYSSPADIFVWSRGTKLVRLKRRGNDIPPLGTYCCVVPDRTSMDRTFCAHLVAITCMPLTVEGVGGISVSYSPDRRDGSGNYYHGTTATYSCSPGYGLSGGRNRMCVGDGDSSSSVGIFNGIAPTCERIACSALPNIANGKITYSTDTTPPYDFQSTATYQCDYGFSLIGERLRTCDGDDSSPNGVWSGQAPRCSGITCSSPPVLGNGSIAFIPGNQQPPYDVNTIATHSCNQEFQLVQGNRERTCVGDGSSVDGSWSGSHPMCKGIKSVVVPPGDPPSFGQRYSLTCTVTRADTLNPTINYQWFKTTGPNRVLVGANSHTLTFDPLVLSDAGQYSCEVTISSTLLLEDIISVSGYYQLKFFTLNFQLRLNGISDCRQYTTLEAYRKAQDITNSIAQGIENICGCGFTTTFISNMFLKCFSEDSPHHVTYRALLSETDVTTTVELLSYIEQWVEATQGMVVRSVELGLNKTCPVIIIDFSSPECPQSESIDNQVTSSIIVSPSTSTPITTPTSELTDTSDNSSASQAVIGGAIAGVLFVILLATAVVILVVVVMRRKVQSLNIQTNEAKVESQSVPLSEVNQSTQAQPYETVTKETTEPHLYETIAKGYEYEVVHPHEHDQAEQTKQQEGDYNLTDCPAYLPTNTVREAPVDSPEEERAA